VFARCLSFVVALVLLQAPQPRYDLVIAGGRVIDPETGLDAVRHVGISGGTVARVSADPLTGAATIAARGLVVAPGFIDLHSHGQDAENDRLKVLDGVTTALELEVGLPDVAKFYAAREGRALVHFGATASHPWARAAALGAPDAAGQIVPASGPATNEPASPAQIERMKDALDAGLRAGALGIGMGLAYTPGATRREAIEIFRLAAARRVPIYVHVRSSGRTEPGSSIEAIAEVIAAAAITGAPLHIVHINSSGLRDAPECLRLVEGARARGLDVTTEAYPYGAGMTMVNSALFNAGWQTRLGIDEKDLQLVETGERLTRESFERLHALPESKAVLLFLNPDEIVDAVITHPLAMVASDGWIERGKGHPRGAGTYARVLARYVREQQRLTLIDAIRKMSYLPARRLEGAAPAARLKGRLQEGADADLVVFDAAAVTDHATYEAPARPSTGFRHVLVGGVAVVRDGAIVEGPMPGKALKGGTAR
jgi:N-acyl-D-aspartate/D-glutamate deacylase